jgi:uncharacterized protein with PIN domain
LEVIKLYLLYKIVTFINKLRLNDNMKCEACNSKIEKTFLNKAIGTYIKDSKGKKHLICNKCQKANKKEELLKNLK